MLSNEELHSKILYPVTRIRSGKSGGSGVLIYSAPDPKALGEYINIVLTCEHSISESIKFRDDWDSILKKDVKTDYFEDVNIEVFDYIGSRVVSSNSTLGEIVAYDKHHDLAAVRLLNPRKMQYIARVIPKENIKSLKLFDSVFASGCSVLHDPFASPGVLTYLREMIAQKSFIMSTAPCIFGNSGGGLFLGEDGYLLGLSSKVTTVQLGFGYDVLTWMSFATHPERLYEFFDHHELQFIYDNNDNYDDAMRRREKRRKTAMRELLLNGSNKEK